MRLVAYQHDPTAESFTAQRVPGLGAGVSAADDDYRAMGGDGGNRSDTSELRRKVSAVHGDDRTPYEAASLRSQQQQRLFEIGKQPEAALRNTLDELAARGAAKELSIHIASK